MVDWEFCWGVYIGISITAIILGSIHARKFNTCRREMWEVEDKLQQLKIRFDEQKNRADKLIASINELKKKG